MRPGDFITYVNPNETPNRSMRICFMGPGDLTTHVTLNEPPNRSMRMCSMGPGNFIIYVSPHETPNRSMRICSMGPGDFITYVNPDETPMFHGAGGFDNSCKPSRNPLIEVCVYVPWGQEIMTRKCYDKEIPGHWDN